MKAASILLALVAVLGFCREAGARDFFRFPEVCCRRNVTVGPYSFGFVDYGLTETDPKPWTVMYACPLGSHSVPFTATQGLIGFIVILVMLISLPIVLTVRWKKKRVAQ